MYVLIYSATSDLFQEFLAVMGEENIVMPDVEPNPVREKIFSFIKVNIGKFSQKMIPLLFLPSTSY